MSKPEETHPQTADEAVVAVPEECVVAEGSLRTNHVLYGLVSGLQRHICIRLGHTNVEVHRRSWLVRDIHGHTRLPPVTQVRVLRAVVEPVAPYVEVGQPRECEEVVLCEAALLIALPM